MKLTMIRMASQTAVYSPSNGRFWTKELEEF